PSEGADIADTYDVWARGQKAADEQAVAVLAMADPDERRLVVAVYLQGKRPGKVAAGLGIDRTTVTRPLSRLFIRVRERYANWARKWAAFMVWRGGKPPGGRPLSRAILGARAGSPLAGGSHGGSGKIPDCLESALHRSAPRHRLPLHGRRRRRTCR